MLWAVTKSHTYNLNNLVPECVFCVKHYRQFYKVYQILQLEFYFQFWIEIQSNEVIFHAFWQYMSLASWFVILMPNVYNFTPVWTPYFIMASRKVIENSRLFTKCMHEKLIFNIFCHCLGKRTEWKHNLRLYIDDCLFSEAAKPKRICSAQVKDWHSW